MSEHILVIDDDSTFGTVLIRALKRRGHLAEAITDPSKALDVAGRLRPGRVILDLNLNGVSGLSLIAPLLELVPEMRIVVLTGYASIATTVDAIKLGATQYLAKPVDVDTLLAAFSSEAAARPELLNDAMPLSVSQLEWEHIQRVLHDHGGNISATARALSMHRRTLQRKLLKPPTPA
jgi:two-component system response regulator RegA